MAKLAVLFFLLAIFIIGSQIRFSIQDLRNTLSGFLVVSIFLLVFNFATVWLSDFGLTFNEWLAEKLVLFYVLMIFILIINSAIYLLLSLFSFVMIYKKINDTDVHLIYILDLLKINESYI